MSLGSIVDVVTAAGEATPENIAAREQRGQVRATALVVAPILAAIGGYYAARSALRRAKR